MPKKIIPINFKFETEFGQLYTLSFYRTRYASGNTCLCCNCTEDGTFYEPYATIFKNFPDLQYFLSDLEICVDVNNIGAKLFNELIELGILTYIRRILDRAIAPILSVLLIKNGTRIYRIRRIKI